MTYHDAMTELVQFLGTFGDAELVREACSDPVARKHVISLSARLAQRRHVYGFEEGRQQFTPALLEIPEYSSENPALRGLEVRLGDFDEATAPHTIQVSVERLGADTRYHCLYSSRAPVYGVHAVLEDPLVRFVGESFPQGVVELPDPAPLPDEGYRANEMLVSEFLRAVPGFKEKEEATGLRRAIRVLARKWAPEAADTKLRAHATVFLSDFVYGVLAERAAELQLDDQSEEIVVPRPGRLARRYQELVVDALSLDLQDAPALLAQLADEMLAAAARRAIVMDWGELTEVGGQAVLRVNPLVTTTIRTPGWLKSERVEVPA